MLTEKELSDANAFGESLRLAVHEQSMPANVRARAAGGCHMIAQNHHHAIVLLLGARLFASAFALLRVEFEAYIRGEWLSLCATEEQVIEFLDCGRLPNIGMLVLELEKIPAFKQQVLSKIKRASWDAMCAYTHTGGLHVQRWMTQVGIESNYSKDEIQEVLRFADLIAALSVLGVLTLVGDVKAAEGVLNRFQARIGK